MHYLVGFILFFSSTFLCSNVAIAGGLSTEKVFNTYSQILKPFIDRDNNGNLIAKNNLIPSKLALELFEKHLTHEAYPYYKAIINALWEERIVAQSNASIKMFCNDRLFCLLGTIMQYQENVSDETQRTQFEMNDLYYRFDDVKGIHRMILSNAICTAVTEPRELEIYQAGLNALEESKRRFEESF